MRESSSIIFDYCLAQNILNLDSYSYTDFLDVEGPEDTLEVEENEGKGEEKIYDQNIEKVDEGKVEKENEEKADALTVESGLLT